MMIAHGLAIACLLSITTLGCATPSPNRDTLGERFPSTRGEALDGKTWRLPREFAGAPVVLLLGYVRDAQFDIDRWLIGLDMTQTEVKVYELPTIRGLAPRMFRSKINEGMRQGIPKALWGGVITIYEDGARVERFTGSTAPNNARVLLLDREGVVRLFIDEGFSVVGLNRLKMALGRLKTTVD